MVNSLGSTWKRWEPHAHSPETALNDQFKGVSWDDYISTLEGLTPELAGIGVTDYFTTEGYRKAREYQLDRSRLGNVLLFANIEMRLAIGTTDNQAVNAHLLVSPEDQEHTTAKPYFATCGPPISKFENKGPPLTRSRLGAP